jgi:hypothetical protein
VTALQTTQTCRRCQLWQRRSDTRGTCFGPQREHLHPAPEAETREDFGCLDWRQKVVFVRPALDLNPKSCDTALAPTGGAGNSSRPGDGSGEADEVR